MKKIGSRCLIHFLVYQNGGIGGKICNRPHKSFDCSVKQTSACLGSFVPVVIMVIIMGGEKCVLF